MAAHDKGGEFYLDQVPFIDIDRGLAPFSAPRIAFNNERHVKLNEGKEFFFPSRNLEISYRRTPSLILS